MKIEIKNRWTGEIIFAHDAEKNSVRIAVEAAIAAGINLRNADLLDADLGYADLRNADLRNADLRNADLRGANLRGANLIGADIDFSRGWTFACVHSRFSISVSFAHQVLAHLCSCNSDDAEFAEIRKKILPYALKSHRAGDLGLLDDCREITEFPD